MIEHTLPITIRITRAAGLDPHASAEFAMVASKFESEITVACKGRLANEKSITEMMSLGALHNELIELHADGTQAQNAVNALIALIQRN